MRPVLLISTNCSNEVRASLTPAFTSLQDVCHLSHMSVHYVTQRAMCCISEY